MTRFPWPSSIAPETMSRGGARYAFPTLHARGALFTESRPWDAGRNVIVLSDTEGQLRDLIPAPFSARCKVHEYGGLPYVTSGDTLYFIEQKDGRVYKTNLDGAAPMAVSAPSPFRLCEPILDATRNRLLFVGELHAEGAKVENGIVALDLATGATHWLIRGLDFVASPALSPDGQALALLTWSLPNMPWDASQLRVAMLDGAGGVVSQRVIAGGEEGAAFQPTWNARGDLVFALEAKVENDAAWNLHRICNAPGIASDINAPLAIERLFVNMDEWGAPLWNLGTRIFDFVDDETIVGVPFREGVSRLVRVGLGGTPRYEVLDEDMMHVGHLACRGDALLLSFGWAGQGNRVALRDMKTGSTRTLAMALGPLFAGANPILRAGDLPVAEHVTFTSKVVAAKQTESQVVHGFFYAPKNADVTSSDALPPLLVIAHGGPTGVTSPIPSVTILQFTTRGFAVLDVNYRGSTGFGRNYREQLRHTWGEVDVDDCVAGARAMAAQGKVDGARMLIRGGSAGGYTLLMALVRHPGVFCAATSLYGVSDPRSLTDDTHKFESGYASYLFGDGETREHAFQTRSPIQHANAITTPVLFLQGTEDKVVTPDQSARMHAALQARGVMTELAMYEGEGHGFRQAATLRDVFLRELAFYERVFAAIKDA